MLRSFYALTVLFSMFVSPLNAHPESAPEIYLQAQQAPVDAIASIDAFLASDTTEDFETRFELQFLKAELLFQHGDKLDAGFAFLDLADIAASNRNVTAGDKTLITYEPITLLERAFEIFEALGELDLAQDALTAMIADLEDGSASNEKIAEIYDRLSNLTQDPQTRDSYRRAAENRRNLPTVGTKGETGIRMVDVFYATDRARSSPSPTRPNEFYGSERGKLELGIARVSIPPHHVDGLIETNSFWSFEFRANSAKHVVLHSVTPRNEDQFYAAMNKQFEAGKGKSALVFIHGYNVLFDAAARRAAQLAYDTRFPGVPILYSWPSQGWTKSYLSDAAVVRLSGRRLANFLDSLVEKSGATSIHIVAHSMGNRALTDALELLALRRGLSQGDAPIFEQVVFAAPDVDADLFLEMLPTFAPTAKRLTLYASGKDRALWASRRLHGYARRAGEAGDKLVEHPLLDSVDMTELGKDMLAHSYFANDPSALVDIQALFWLDLPPVVRCGLTKLDGETRAASLWRFVKGTCADPALLAVMALLRQNGVTTLEQAGPVVRDALQDDAYADELMPILSKMLTK